VLSELCVVRAMCESIVSASTIPGVSKLVDGATQADNDILAYTACQGHS
jgi:hypothetical protein